MARPSQLEAQLTAVTQRFVAEIVEMIRHASVADVAGFDLRPLSHASASPRGARSAYASGGSAEEAGAASPSDRVPVFRPHSASGRRAPATTSRSSSGPSRDDRDERKPRQTAERRAELGERVLEALRRASEPMGVRALASELHVAPDLLSAPLLELRAAGKLTKHGEKRATTYEAL